MRVLGGDATADVPSCCIAFLVPLTARDPGGIAGDLRSAACEVTKFGDGSVNAKREFGRLMKVDDSLKDPQLETRRKSLHGSREH